MAISAPAAAQTAVGDWHGTLDVGGTKLRLAVHVQQAAGGELTGTLDSPDQGASGIPIDAISTDQGILAFAVPAVGGSYAGQWDSDGRRWRGEWRQAGNAWPLNFDAGLLPASETPSPPPLPENWTIPGDAAIARLIEERNALRAGQGMVVGVISDGERVVARGPAGAAPFDGSSLFEIGSISKVFTALLLADMVNKGEVALDDPAAKYLPAGHRMPERGGRQITLKDLSQHASGLPRIPDNMRSADPEDPYADYTEDQLLAFLDGYQLPRDIGAQSDYSNLGVGLLGYLLGRAAGKDYETLLAERITRPLGMDRTVVTLPQGARLVPGYDVFMRPAKPWNLPTLMGAGGIRSTTEDMLKFAEAVLDPASPIADAVATTVANRFAGGNPGLEQALGWQIFHPSPGRNVFMHNGGTGGYRSALLVDRERGSAVVVLMNSAVEPSATDFAMHLMLGSPLAETQPVPPAPATRAEVALPETELQRVVGRYDFGAGVVFVITLEGSTLSAQRQGGVSGPVLPIFAEAPLRFFWKVGDLQIRFTTDSGGAVTGAVFSGGGQEMTGRRVEP